MDNIEELIEDLIYASYNFHKGVEFKSKASERIRTLLQSHRPSVTREEIYELLRELDERYGINCVNSVTFEIGELLKSKGIPVKGEK